MQPEAVAAACPAKVGLLHDTLRRAKKQPTLLAEALGRIPGLQEAHGRRARPHLVVQPQLPAALGAPGQYRYVAQTLFWPTLNWDIFDSKTFGSGSFQFFYYGERRSGSKVTASRGSRTLSGELPDYQNKYSQITYTHTLPGEKFAVAVGQYSFFNFDSSEFMADQQLNFVNNIFSANGSATYPTTGTGGYVQFNATKNLQFLAGGQSVNVEDPSKRPTDGFLSSPYAWLGYVQWTPPSRASATRSIRSPCTRRRPSPNDPPHGAGRSMPCNT